MKSQINVNNTKMYLQANFDVKKIYYLNINIKESSFALSTTNMKSDIKDEIVIVTKRHVKTQYNTQI